jgi:hypothetical protein
MIQVNKVKELDVRTGEMQEYDANEMANKAVKQKIEDSYGDVGIKVKIEEIEDPEKFADSFYRSQGYKVLNLEPQGNNQDFSLSLKSQIKTESQENLEQGGIPDLFVYKEDDERDLKDYFFAEVKHGNDSLSTAQIEWIFHKFRDVPVKICFTKKPNRTRY